MITPIELQGKLGAMNESAQDLANALADAVRAVSSAGRREKYLRFHNSRRRSVARVVRLDCEPTTFTTHNH